MRIPEIKRSLMMSSIEKTNVIMRQGMPIIHVIMLMTGMRATTKSAISIAQPNRASRSPVLLDFDVVGAEGDVGYGSIKLLGEL